MLNRCKIGWKYILPAIWRKPSPLQNGSLVSLYAPLLSKIYASLALQPGLETSSRPLLPCINFSAIFGRTVQLDIDSLSGCHGCSSPVGTIYLSNPSGGLEQKIITVSSVHSPIVRTDRVPHRQSFHTDKAQSLIHAIKQGVR